MTMRGSNFDAQAENFGKISIQFWKKNGKHIADIEEYRVVKCDGYYSLWNVDDQLIAYCLLSDFDNKVDNIWVSKEYRGKKIFSMMLWFFKTRLNKDYLVLGSVHSTDMQEVVKGLSRFNKTWMNIYTGEKRPFDVTTLDDYYSYMKPTDWRLVLENDGEFGWPMFNGNGFIKESYTSYIE